MEFRRANRADIDTFLENRLEFVTSIRNISDIEAFKQSTRQYLHEHIDKDDLIIFIATEESRIVSSCMACIYQMVPLASCLSGKSAELLNVYTIKEYRNKGYAEKLIRMLFEETRNCGVKKILLDYTDMGYPLYKKLGFTELDRHMELSL